MFSDTDTRHANGNASEQEGPAFHFADNPGRRNGERGYIKMSHDVQAKRLYGRATPPAPPEPDNLRETYQSALSLITRYRPLRADRLHDLIGRVEYAFHRYTALKAEHEWRFQNVNEEARNANDWIDNRVSNLRAERAEAIKKWESEIAERRDALALANEEAAAAHTASGHPMPYRYRGPEEDTADPAPAASAIGNAVSNAVEQAAASLPAALAQVAATPQSLLNRLRGRLTFSVSKDAVASPPPVETHSTFVPVPTAETGPVRVPRRAYPDTVPFPLAQGLEQAAPLEAIAMQQGLPSESPMAAGLKTKQHWIEWFALLACGSIFGASIGLLTNMVSRNAFQFNIHQAAGTLAALCSLGVFMFWVLGRVVFAAAAMASEDRHLHLVASHRDAPDKVGDWLRRASSWALAVMIFIAVVLVTVEAVVERYGIVSNFADAMQNQAIASGQTGVVGTGVSSIALIFMVLTVSLPFVLLHMAHGWAYARGKVFYGYLIGKQKQQAWQIAQKCHAERTEQRAALFAKESDEEQTAWELVQKEYAAAKQQAADQAALDRLHAQDNLAREASETYADVSGAGVEASIGLQEEAQSPGSTVILGVASATAPEEPLYRKEDVARLLARAWEAEQRWRRTRKERHDAASWYDERIKATEAERQQETPHQEPSNKQHEDAAHVVYTNALKHFEDTYQREARVVEKMMQAGLLLRFWLALMRRPAFGAEVLSRPPGHS